MRLLAPRTLTKEHIVTTATAEKVIYASRIQQHRFVITSPRPLFDPTKTAIIGYEPGKVLQFERGRYETSDVEEIAFLDKAVGTGSPDLMRLTAEEAGQASPSGGVSVLPFAGTKQSATPAKEYRCTLCGAANFVGPNAALEYGRHVRAHNVEAKKAEKAAKAAAGASG
jgi:hypothetical protein